MARLDPHNAIAKPIALLLMTIIAIASCSETKDESSTPTKPTTATSTSPTTASATSGTAEPRAITSVSTTTAIRSAVPSTTTISSEELPPELVEMYDWDPENGFHDTTLTGTLTIEVRCAYLDSTLDGGDPLRMPHGTRLRTFLYLSELRTRFESETGALWVNGNGPMYTGDKVTLIGSEGWRLDDNINSDDGTEEWGSKWDSGGHRDPRGQCSANESLHVASMASDNIPDTNVPRVSELPGLGLFRWDSNFDLNDIDALGGVLIIDPPCVYFIKTTDVSDDWEEYASKPTRHLLSLARPYTRYDFRTETLYNGPFGPFSSGDKVELHGNDPTTSDPQDEFIADDCTANGTSNHSVHRSHFMRHPSKLFNMPRHRYERTRVLPQILDSIREIENTRIAGWGTDPNTLKGWVLLAGDEPPNPDAARIASAHDDIDIRIGAEHTHAELLTAKRELFNHIEPTGVLADIERIVTFTGIDMEANAVRIGIDPALDNPCNLTTPDPATNDEDFQAKAAEITQQLQETLAIAFVIVDGRGFGIPNEPPTHCPTDQTTE